MRYLKKVGSIIIMVFVVSCFSPTENKDKLPNDAQLFRPVGNVYFNDLLNKSAEAKKPLLLYFTYITGRSSYELENVIINDKKLSNSLRSDYIFVPLYVDDKEILPTKEQFYSKIMEKEVKTVGSKYSHWEMEKFGTNATPLFVTLDEKGKKIKELMFTKDLLKFHGFFLESELKHIK